MAILIDGKVVAAQVKERLRAKVAELAARGVKPGLAVVIVGGDPASRVYVNNKERDCAEIGVRSEEYALGETTKQEELLELIGRLNARFDIHGILVQLPLPKGLDEKKVLAAISPDKDVDAFHPQSVGHIMIGDHTFLPCTPAGVMELIRSTGVDPCGKECVIIGRSNIVGKPMAMLMLQANATVTVCHSRTADLPGVCRRADILIVAIGRAKMIDSSYIKPGAVVIDVGMNRDENGRLCGDVDFASVEPLASYITPVPGGVGPMTRAMLMCNTVAAASAPRTTA